MIVVEENYGFVVYVSFCTQVVTASWVIPSPDISDVFPHL